MEDTLPVGQPEEAPKGCSNCGNPSIDKEYPTTLCHDCREQFIRFPVPLWIKAFAGAIAIVLLVSLVTLPKNISLAMHLERGEKAENEKNYLTAQHELTEVVNKVPDNIEAEGHLLIASFYNQDFDVFGKVAKKLEGVNIEDKELFSRMDELLVKAGSYVSNDSAQKFQENYVKFLVIPDSAWQHYFLANPDDLYAETQYASLLYNGKKYTSCDSLLQNVLKKDDEYFPALMMRTSLEREQGQFDKALACCDKLLSINKESVYALAAKARILLCQKKDGQALDLAIKSFRMNEKNAYSLATLILAYHFNNRSSERDELIKKSKTQETDSASQYQVQYALDVIANKEKFRE